MSETLIRINKYLLPRRCHPTFSILALLLHIDRNFKMKNDPKILKITNQLCKNTCVILIKL